VHDERREQDRNQRLHDEDDRRHEDRRPALERAHLAGQPDERRGGGADRPARRRSPVPVAGGVGDELVHEAAPREAEARADHRDVGHRATRELEEERRERGHAEQAEHDVDADAVHVMGGVARGERRDPRDAGDDRRNRGQLASPGRLAEQPLAGEQQHEQARRERRLDDDERREREREDLQRPARHGHRGAGQPARAADELREQREAQRVLRGRLPRVERLHGDP